MTTYAIYSTRRLAGLLAAALVQSQFAFADGCDLPMFAGARLFGASPGGARFMATGDFNHDGILDVATADGANTVSIVLGRGDGTFQPAVNYQVAQPKNLAVGDFNGDGKLDLVIWSSFNTAVMLGNGDGTFKAPITVNGGGVPVVGDFNGDGKLDVVIGTPVSILLGKGDGTFQPPIFPSGGAAGSGVAAGDFNGDGKLDVIAGSNDGVQIMLGDGKGNFGNAVDVGFGANPTQVAVGDFNGDHKLDIAALDSLGSNLWVLLGNGNGTFQRAISYPVASPPATLFGLLVADLNGDGVPDLAVAGHTQVTPPFGGLPSLALAGTIFVFPGNGDGSFQSAVQYQPTTGENTYALAAGDFNGDGLTDLAFANDRTSTPMQVGIMFGTATGTFLTPSSYALGALPTSPVLADLNGDGVLDMVVVNYGSTAPGSLSVSIGNGDGTFQPAVSYPAALGANSVAVGDFNGDRKPDIAVANGSASNILVFPGRGDGTFGAPIKGYSSFGPIFYLAAGDFNKDGKLDLAVMTSAGIQIVLGNGDGTFRGGIGALDLLNRASGPVAVADLNGDGNPDVVYTASSLVAPVRLQAGNIYVLLGHGDGTFAAAVSYTIGDTAIGLAIGDLNGDGKPDLAVADFGAADVAVLLGNGDGTFQTAKKYPAITGAVAVAMSDFNGDGNLDLAVVSNGAGAADASPTVAPAGAVTVLLGQGDGAFRNALVYGAGSDPQALAVGDINGDAQPDLVFTDITTSNALVLMNNHIPGSSGSACTAVQPLSN